MLHSLKRWWDETYWKGIGIQIVSLNNRGIALTKYVYDIGAGSWSVVNSNTRLITEVECSDSAFDSSQWSLDDLGIVCENPCFIVIPNNWLRLIEFNRSELGNDAGQSSEYYKWLCEKKHYLSSQEYRFFQSRLSGKGNFTISAYRKLLLDRLEYLARDYNIEAVLHECAFFQFNENFYNKVLLIVGADDWTVFSINSSGRIGYFRSNSVSNAESADVDEMFSSLYKVIDFYKQRGKSLEPFVIVKDNNDDGSVFIVKEVRQRDRAAIIGTSEYWGRLALFSIIDGRVIYNGC